jgi:hypothetical protein
MRRMTIGDRWRRQEQRSVNVWASRIGEEAGRLRERRRLIMMTSYLIYFSFVAFYWVALSIGSRILDILALSVGVGGMFVALYAGWVSRQAKVELTDFLRRPRKELRHARMQRISAYDAWIARHPSVP